jgi:putative NIF3 family GTP cyclohydrolase 1 type 2
MKVSISILGFLCFQIIFLTVKSQNLPLERQRSAAQVIETIIQNTGSPNIPNTVDVIKEGDPESKVTGIVTTMFGTMDVLRKAVQLKANLVVVHEPLYYNHRDETAQFINDPVFQEKEKFINDHGIVVWRFHDYIHSIKPDGILSGMVIKLGWKNYVVGGDMSRYIIPDMTLNELLAYLKTKFPASAFNIIGDPEMKISSVRLLPGAPGSMAQITSLEDKNIDLVIAGEVPQWETYEYMRDAVSQGKKKAIIFLGHIPSEEAGMEFCAGWIRGFLKDIPVTFVESGPSYWTY